MKFFLLFIIALVSGTVSYGQLESGHAYLMGDKVNVAIFGERGNEGTDVSGAGFHQRAPADRCGFVADPYGTGWDPTGFNGDFFMPGAQENGWGVQIDGINYGNNYNVYEIERNVDNPISHSIDGDCITVEWEGDVAGIRVNLKYHLVQDELFYTTEITLINNSGEDKTDIYYYRNVDPDNNQFLSGSYVTTNTIVSQPEGDCQKSLVSAEAFTPHDSYVGFGALGSKFRVSHGGFSNRNGSNIWNATGLEGTVGAVAVEDQAISLAYKTDLPDTDTINFTFAVVLSADAVEDAFSSLYYVDYTSIGGDGGGLINQCNPVVDTALSCNGTDVTLTVDGPNAEDYDWIWSSDPFDPDLVTDAVTVIVSPDVTTTYTVTGTPISDCLSSTITKTIVVKFSEGPEISITNPGAFCEEFDITTLVFEDLSGTIDPNIIFLTEYPDSSDQVEPEFVGPMMGPDDEVWLLIGDPEAGCYDAVLVEIEFGGLGSAGDDAAIALCGTEGTIIDLHDLISDGANLLGSFNETTFSGQFDEATGEFDVSGLGDTYIFEYSVEGVDPCPEDVAIFTVEVYPQPDAKFMYAVGENSSEDGLGSTCIENTIDFTDQSTIPDGGTITGWSWNFGDGSGSSSDEDPSYTYSSTGTFTITLTVTTADGCSDTFTKEIIIYLEPILDIIYNDPLCYGYSDGSVTVFVAGGSGTFDIVITDSDGVVLNEGGSNTANVLGDGTYTITVTDDSGCDATATVVLTEPDQLVPYFRVIEPNCFGEAGYIVVDSVHGENINNLITYIWTPDPVGGHSGLDADSLWNATAGDYTLLITDSDGCNRTVDITVTQPDELVWAVDSDGVSQLGSKPAYCRLYGYQNGGGIVFAAASGGTPDYEYVWEELSTGTTTTNTTWGGRNPGEYRITATDDHGCILTEVITLDSVNPIANFTIDSDQLNADHKGTAAVEAVFTNTSENYLNDSDPSAEASFFWNLDDPNATDILTHEFEFKPDTIYKAKGESYEVIVCLLTQNHNGCQDEICKTITVFEPITFVDVNIFSPNGDGENDLFTFRQYAASISTFNCVITNRWGIKVGQIVDIEQGWDGTDNNGDACKDGVYFYTYEASADNGDSLSGQGTVTIVGTLK